MDIFHFWSSIIVVWKYVYLEIIVGAGNTQFKKKWLLKFK